MIALRARHYEPITMSLHSLHICCSARECRCKWPCILLYGTEEGEAHGFPHLTHLSAHRPRSLASRPSTTMILKMQRTGTIFSRTQKIHGCVNLQVRTSTGCLREMPTADITVRGTAVCRFDCQDTAPARVL